MERYSNMDVAAMADDGLFIPDWVLDVQALTDSQVVGSGWEWLEAVVNGLNLSPLLLTKLFTFDPGSGSRSLNLPFSLCRSDLEAWLNVWPQRESCCSTLWTLTWISCWPHNGCR